MLTYLITSYSVDATLTLPYLTPVLQELGQDANEEDYVYEEVTEELSCVTYTSFTNRPKRIAWGLQETALFFQVR